LPTNTATHVTTLDLGVTNSVSAQQISITTSTHSPWPPAGPCNGGNAMSMSIEDLARDRMRQIRADSEAARQVRRARAARKAASRG
jgi:hypothetical protein